MFHRDKETDCAIHACSFLSYDIVSHDPRQSRGLEEALEGHDTDNAPKGASNGSANCIADSWRAPEGAFFYALVFLLPVNGSMNSFMLI